MPHNAKEAHQLLTLLSDVIAQMDIYDKLSSNDPHIRVGVTCGAKDVSILARLKEVRKTSRKGYAHNRLLYALNRRPSGSNPTWSGPLEVKFDYLVRGLNDALAGNPLNALLDEESIFAMYYGPRGSIYRFGYAIGSSIVQHHFIWEDSYCRC